MADTCRFFHSPLFPPRTDLALLDVVVLDWLVVECDGGDVLVDVEDGDVLQDEVLGVAGLLHVAPQHGHVRMGVVHRLEKAEFVDRAWP